MSERFFAPCPRGLEAALAAELAALGAADVSATDGGVGLRRATGARHARQPRVAPRQPHPVARRRRPVSRRARAVRRSCKAIDWKRHFAATRTLRVDVAATRSPLQSLEFATLRVKDAVCDRFRADVERAPVHRQARARRARPRLPHRARRDDLPRHVGRAAVQARLPARRRRGAAAREPRRRPLALTGWTPARRLLDPMCGSGTIVDRGRADRRRPRAGARAHVRLPEARVVRRAVVAAHEAGRARPREHAARRADDLRERHRAGRGRARRSREPARRAGRWLRAASSRPTSSRVPRPRPPASSLANPPYGVRLADQEAMARQYPLLGDALKQRFAGLDRVSSSPATCACPSSSISRSRARRRS